MLGLVLGELSLCDRNQQLLHSQPRSEKAVVVTL